MRAVFGPGHRLALFLLFAVWIDQCEGERKRGEQMTLEVIQQITELEAEQQALREAAATQSKLRLQQTKQAGERLIVESRQAAEAKCRQMLLDAENQAAAESEKILAAAREDCQKLQAAARGHLPKAAVRILEKVVKIG